MHGAMASHDSITACWQRTVSVELTINPLQRAATSDIVCTMLLPSSVCIVTPSGFIGSFQVIEPDRCSAVRCRGLLRQLLTHVVRACRCPNSSFNVTRPASSREEVIQLQFASPVTSLIGGPSIISCSRFPLAQERADLSSTPPPPPSALHQL